MSPDQYRLMAEEIARRSLLAQSRIDVLADPGVFRQQKEAIEHPAKLKAIFCTRRSAKSYTAGLYLMKAALDNPGCNVIFIGLTRASSKGIIWKDVLKDINRRISIGAVPNETDLTFTLPNGSVIYVTGADADKDEMNKLLGRKFRLACIDEASMYSIDVRNMVYGVLGPAMTDPNAGGERGTICLMGTASNFPRGLFYDVTTRKEPGWELFQWTAHDNPHVATQWQEALDDIAKNRPLYMETPQFKQWYLNQWVIDEEKLVYRFNPQRNLLKSLPNLPHDGWTRVLGVDLGWEDDSAFVLTAYHANDPNLYVIKSFARKRMEFDNDDPSVLTVASKIREFMQDSQWSPHKVIIDGANKQGVESMRSRTAIPFEYADKQGKVDFIELCNSDLVQGKIKVLDTAENNPLFEEGMSLVWMTEGDKIKIPKKEHPNLPNHRLDAFLYAWRMGYHFHAEASPKKIMIGSRQWYEQQAVDIWEKEREKLEERKDLWPSEDW